MFSLPLLAGLLFILQGQEISILEAKKVPLDTILFRRFVNQLYAEQRHKQLLHEASLDKRQDERPNPDIWSLDDEEEDVDKVVNDALNRGLNFAEKDPEVKASNNPDQQAEETKGSQETEKDGTADTAATTTDDTNVAAQPLPPQKQTSNVIGVPKKDLAFVALVAACSIAGLVGLIMAGVCWYKLHSRVKAASDVDYPAYGVTGPTKERLPSPGDRKLAQSAQMYHYQHQKQQMIAMEKANCEMKHDASDDESEEENEEGDYTVYECPGLAPTGEMEIRNPLFTEEAQTPVNDGEKSAPTKDLSDDTHE